MRSGNVATVEKPKGKYSVFYRVHILATKCGRSSAFAP